MIDQMNFSREFNTLYMASSPRAKFRTLSQHLWLFSMYQSAFLCEYISSNMNIYFMLSNQQTGSTDQLEHLESNQTLFNAFSTSRKATTTCSPLLKLSMMNWDSLNMWSSVDLALLKPD